MTQPPKSEFVSEPIKPIELMIGSAVIAGEPILPRTFLWRDQIYEIDRVIDKWKETSPCHSGGNELYVRKHWYKIKTTDGLEMCIYFERQPSSKRQTKQRWWLFSVSK